MFIFEFKPSNGRLGLLFDGVYMKLSYDLTSASPLATTLNGKFTQQYYAAALTYRVNDGPAALDLIGGVRYYDLRIRLQVPKGLLAPRSNEESKGSVDGFVGARVVVPVAERWSFVGYGDVGAGGSDFSWQALIGGSYKVSDSGDVRLRLSLHGGRLREGRLSLGHGYQGAVRQLHVQVLRGLREGAAP